MLGLLAGCEKLLSIQDPVAGDGRAGGDGGGGDGGLIDGGGLSPSSPILLSEVALAPDSGEMIEIVNTSNQEVDLSTYYLSDSGNYFRLPATATVDPSDFIVKFPPNARIPAHGVLTIAIDTPANFSAVYGMSPSFSVVDGSMEMTRLGTLPIRLTSGGEPIILFQWDGVSDLVRDVDIMLAGIPSSGNPLPDKSGVQQDGSDPDTSPSAYATDVRSIKAQPAAPSGTESTKRIALEDGHETHNGTGNGPAGEDETSEDTSVTWDGTVATPFSAPTPGQVPAALLR